jgi:hypothetical protein
VGVWGGLNFGGVVASQEIVDAVATAARLRGRCAGDSAGGICCWIALVR